MTAIFSIDQLEVVAVLGDHLPTSDLRQLEPVFRRRDLPDRIVWPERIERAHVVATEVGSEVLATAVAAGAAVMLATTVAARGSDWALLAAVDGGVRYLRRDELWAREHSLMRDALSRAIHAWHDDDRELSIDLFDRAYLVSRRAVVATVLRAGASRLSGDSEWADMCFADLERTLEYQGTAMLSCRANALWRDLPHQALIAELFDEARRGFDERAEADGTFEPPVPPRTKQLAVALALYRRLRPAASARLPSKLVIRAVAGEPNAADAIAATLAADDVWQHCVEQAGVAEGAAQADVSDALARAQLEDLGRFARTLYTLEISSDERDRRTSWTSFCRVTAGVDTSLDAVPWRAGERLADEARRRLGLNGDPIGGLRRFAEEQAGVFIGQMARLDRYDCASSVPRNTPPCVFVEQISAPRTDEMLRGRFAVAHELGHLLADRHAAPGWVCSTTGHDRADIEKRANAFAAYFLAPRHAVLALVPNLPTIESPAFSEAAQLVRARFGLLPVAAGEHLRNCHGEHVLGGLPSAVRQRLAHQLADQPTDVHEDDDESSQDLPLRQGRYRVLVDRLTGAGVIDAERATSLLEPT